jgi:hypothetical protein
MDAFSNQLLPGEKIVWSGAPGQGIILNSRDILMIPFSLMWGGFAIFWEVMTFRMKGTPMLFHLWGIPFILMGLYFIFGRFFFDAYLRSKMQYAVTNRRILISGPRPFASITTLNLGQLPEIKLKEGQNGRGTIFFGPQSSANNRNDFAGLTPALDSTRKFIDVEGAQTLFMTIQRLVPVGGPVAA